MCPSYKLFQCNMFEFLIFEYFFPKKAHFWPYLGQRSSYGKTVNTLNDHARGDQHASISGKLHLRCGRSSRLPEETRPHLVLTAIGTRSIERKDRGSPQAVFDLFLLMTLNSRSDDGVTVNTFCPFWTRPHCYFVISISTLTRNGRSDDGITVNTLLLCTCGTRLQCYFCHSI
jgi:hypothetical protein